MKLVNKIFLYFLTALVFLSLVAAENYNLTFPIQMKEDDQLYDGSKSLTYRLKYDDGTAFYSKTETKTIADGILNVILNDLKGYNYSRDASFTIQVSGESETEGMKLTNSWDSMNNPWNWDGTSSLWMKNTSLKIGVGMINPTAKLHVNGSINVTSGNNVCIEGGNCLGSLVNNTDNQTLSYSSGNITISGGNSINISLIDTDDQTCAEVTGCVVNAITASQDQNNYTSSVSVSGTTTKSINLAIVGRTAINATFNDIDTNCNSSGACSSGGVLYLDYQNSGGINLTGDLWIGGDIMPVTTLSQDLGSGANRWRYLYVQNISADNIVVIGEITADTMNVTTTYIDELRVNTINASYIYNPNFPGSMDLRADPWYLAGADLEIAQDLDVDANANIDGNMTIDGWVKSSNWSNVSISTSQISDFNDQNNYSSGLSVNSSGSTEQINLARNGMSNLTATFTDNDTTYSNSTGLSLSGTTFSHTDASSVSDSDNGGNTFIQDITFDSLGHVLTIGTAAVSEVGDVEGVTAGTGLVGGGTSGNITLNVSAETCGTGNYSYYNGSKFICRSDETGASSDQNNYTTSIGFNETGDTIQLNIAIIGRSNLSATFTDTDTDTDTWWSIVGSKYLYNCSGALCVNETALNATMDARYYLKTAIDTQGEVETIWGVTLATDSELDNATIIRTISTWTGGDLSGTGLAAVVSDDSHAHTKSSVTIAGENVTSGTIADARIASTITRDSEVPSLETDAAHDTCAEVTGCVENAITSSQDQNNYTTSIGFNVSGTTTQLNIAINGRSNLSATFTDQTSSDGNNYTTAAGFNGAILNLAITGRSNVTATIPDNSIKLDYTNITNHPSDQNNYTSTAGFNGAILNLAITGRSNVTATIPDNSIKLDYTNISNSPWFYSEANLTGLLNDNYVDVAGDSMSASLNFTDNVKIYLGTDHDVYIMYNSTGGYGELG